MLLVGAGQTMGCHGLSMLRATTLTHIAIAIFFGLDTLLSLTLSWQCIRSTVLKLMWSKTTVVVARNYPWIKVIIFRCSYNSVRGFV